MEGIGLVFDVEFTTEKLVDNIALELATGTEVAFIGTG